MSNTRAVLSFSLCSLLLGCSVPHFSDDCSVDDVGESGALVCEPIWIFSCSETDGKVVQAEDIKCGLGTHAAATCMTECNDGACMCAIETVCKNGALWSLNPCTQGENYLFDCPSGCLDGQSCAAIDCSQTKFQCVDNDVYLVDGCGSILPGPLQSCIHGCSEGMCLPDPQCMIHSECSANNDSVLVSYSCDASDEEVEVLCEYGCENNTCVQCGSDPIYKDCVGDTVFWHNDCFLPIPTGFEECCDFGCVEGMCVPG